MRVLIVGCGYVGLPLGEALVRQGHQVYGLRRSPESTGDREAAGIVPLTGDISNPADVAALPAPFDWIVNTVSSSKGDAQQYRQVFLQGTRNLMECFRTAPPQKYIYTSSTSVYGQTDGAIVKETSPTEPITETGRILVETEKLLLGAPEFPAIILRVSGIYGPERGHLFQQYLRDEATIPGQGDRLINMIHRDDVDGAIAAALKHGRKGEIYNVTDDEPVTQLHFFRWLSEALGKPMPPSIPESAESAGKRALTNKRVLNRKLRMELGYALKYPTFRNGYTAEIYRLERAGLLDPKPGSGEARASGREPEI